MKSGSVRRLDIVLRSAAGLKKVHTIASRTAAYAVAWILPSVRVPSPMAHRHGRNPIWDTTISMTLDERTLGGAAAASKCQHIELLGQGLVSTTPIGFARVDMTDLLLQGSHGAAVRSPSHDHLVTRRSGRQQGLLDFELCSQGSTSSPSVQENVDLGCGVAEPNNPRGRNISVARQQEEFSLLDSCSEY